MLSGHQSARRRRGRNSRAARIAVPLAIPMALGLTLGMILAVSAGRATTIDQSALGSCASPDASAPALADPTTSAPASPTRPRVRERRPVELSIPDRSRLGSGPRRSGLGLSVPELYGTSRPDHERSRDNRPDHERSRDNRPDHEHYCGSDTVRERQRRPDD